MGSTNSTLISRNPATGETLKELPVTTKESLGEIFTQARTAQQIWAAFSLRRRARVLFQIREALLNHLDELIELTGYNRRYAMGLLGGHGELIKVGRRLRLAEELRGSTKRIPIDRRDA